MSSRVLRRCAPLVALYMCGAAVVRTPSLPRAAPVVRGQLVLPDEGSPVGLHAYLTSRTGKDSTAIDASGAFSLTVGEAHCGPLELRVDVPSAAERRYHPATVRLGSARSAGATRATSPSADTIASLRILVVPTQVVIDGGTYADAVVPIHVDAAVAPAGERSRYWRVARPTRGGYGTPIAWPDGIFPIPVTLRARGGVSSADSATFWRTVRQLEADLGRSLFQPAPDQPAPEELWKIIVAIEPRATAPGLTFITYDAAGEIFEATIAIRSSLFLSDARLVTHELIHALGFGHASSWYSAMGASWTASSRATVTDIGYAQLLYRLRRAHIANRVTHGVLASAAESRGPLSERASQCVR